MKIVHLYANWKWTGPAEPALNLAAALAGHGHEVVFAPGKPPGELPNQISEKAAERGVRLYSGLTLDKHFRPLANLADRRRLVEWLRGFRPDILHCHTLNDHLIGGRALRKLDRRTPLVRSLYDGAAPGGGIRNRLTLGRMTSFLFVASERVREEVVSRFRLDPDRSAKLEVPVDLGRFDPERPLPDLRSHYGIEEGDFVVGIVARMQRRRRFEVLFDALEHLAGTLPRLRLLVVGRGTRMEEVAVSRARRSPLADRIVFTGYRAGEEYVATLAAMHVKVFLWPGSDGSCRAVREAMAMGRPVVAARTGMLPEIVTDGVDGLLVSHDGADLARALLRLAGNVAERAEMGRRARQSALSRFDPERQVETVEAVYRRLGARPAGTNGRST